MAITNIAVNFTPCVPGPIDGYNIEYRVVGDALYIDAGNFMSSPANISVSYPDGTQFEGIVHSPCGDVIWSTVTIPDEGCGCRFGFPGEDELAGENRQFDVTSAYSFVFTGSGAITLQVNNSNGIPLYALSSNGSAAVVGENNSSSTGVAGIANSGTGGYFQSASGPAVWGLTITGFAAGVFQVNPATVDTVQNVVRLNRNTSGTAANGIGGSLEYYVEDDSGSLQLSTSLVSDWLIAAAGTRRSEFYITGVDNAVTATLFMLAGTGEARLNKYGVGTFLDTPVYIAGFLADGTIIEVDINDLPGGGSGSGGAEMFRFAYPGEDSTAGEERLFNLGTLYRIEFIGNFDTAVHDSIFKVTNQADSGQAILAIGVGTAGAIRGLSDGGYAGQFASTDGIGSLSSSVNALGAMISSVNNIGAQISSDGTYSTSCQVSAANNNSVLPNVLLGALTINAPAEDGFGQSLDFQTNTLDAGTIRTSNQIISRWTIADDTTGQSELKITGVAAGALWDLISIQGDGIFVFLQGVFEYADDTAAAAGTPVIPIGGVYRIGNALQVRLT